MKFFVRATIVWGVIILVESIHGIARTLFLQPVVGDFRARQISVFTGAAIIFAITLAFIRWIRPHSPKQLVGVGIFWLVLTVSFEVILGRAAMHLSWERLFSDYDLPHGGLMPVGLVLLALSPLAAARFRGVIPPRKSDSYK